MLTRFAPLFPLAALAIAASGDTFVVPPVKLSLTIGQQPVAIVTSGTIQKLSAAGDGYRVSLLADLSDFQQNLTALLKPEIDRSDQCGDRIDLRNASIVPHAPAALVTIQVHYERWVCAKALGKKLVKRLLEGNGVVPVTFTPAFENDAVRIDAQAGEVQADGSLGELLRSGSLGQALRDKIHKSVQSAIEKSTDFNATIPPALKDMVKFGQIEFRDAGAGRLALGVDGEVHIAADKLKSLAQGWK
jgi:hypothetical protein